MLSHQLRQQGGVSSAQMWQLTAPHQLDGGLLGWDLNGRNRATLGPPVERAQHSLLPLGLHFPSQLLVFSTPLTCWFSSPTHTPGCQCLKEEFLVYTAVCSGSVLGRLLVE